MSYGTSVSKSLIAGALGYAGARFILGESPYDAGSVFGWDLSAPVAAGISCGLGTLATDMAGQKVLAMAPQTVVGALTVTGSEAVVAGAVTSGVVYGSGGAPGMGFVLGAGANLGAEAISSKMCSGGRCDVW